MKKVMNTLTVISLIGLTGTVVSCYKATVKATNRNRVIYNIEGKQPDRKRKIKENWKLYIKTGIWVGITAGCIIGMDRYSIRTYNNLVTFCMAYQERVAERLGPEEAEELWLEVEGDCIAYRKMDPKNIVMIDRVLKIPIETTMEDYYRARYDTNRLYAKQCYSSLYDFYKYLDISDSQLNRAYKNSKNLAQYLGDDWIDIDLIPKKDRNGNDYYVLVYDFKPFPGLSEEDYT